LHPWCDQHARDHFGVTPTICAASSCLRLIARAPRVAGFRADSAVSFRPGQFITRSPALTSAAVPVFNLNLSTVFPRTTGTWREIDKAWVVAKSAPSLRAEFRAPRPNASFPRSVAIKRANVIKHFFSEQNVFSPVPASRGSLVGAFPRFRPRSDMGLGKKSPWGPAAKYPWAPRGQRDQTASLNAVHKKPRCEFNMLPGISTTASQSQDAIETSPTSSLKFGIPEP